VPKWSGSETRAGSPREGVGDRDEDGVRVGNRDSDENGVSERDGIGGKHDD